MVRGNSTSNVDERLRYMRIVDEDKLYELERVFPASIKLGPAGRYGCRLWVEGEIFEFKLGVTPEGEDFFVTRNGEPLDSGTFKPQRLYQLIRHRAAEVIGAVRAGHREYNQRPRRKAGK